MTDSVEVKPRYHEISSGPSQTQGHPSILNSQNTGQTPIQTPGVISPTIGSGLFVSLAENKLIVFIIVIAIIIIGIVAYVIYRKPEEVKPTRKSKVPGDNNEDTPSPDNQDAQTKQSDTTQTKQSEPVQSKQTDQPDLSKQKNKPSTADKKTNLANMLKRSKQIVPKQTITNAKTDDEIMELMEDDSSIAQFTNADENIDCLVDDIADNIECEDNTQDECVSSDVKVSDIGAKCIATSATGHPCRNKALNNGKCSRHKS